MPAPALAAISTSVLVAIIAAGSSLLTAVVTAALTRRNTAAKARLSYNYEARKRLYGVCEPLLFQASEQAEEACARISGLAKASQRGQLRADGSGWLDAPNNYYFQSTVYSLLAPITTFSILQRRLTTIDLGLDAGVRSKYELLKLIFFSFKSDWTLAASSAAATGLEYDRNRTDPGEPERDRLLRDSPQRFAPQGLYRVMIYVVAEALIASADDTGEAGVAARRCMTFGEFQRAWSQAESEQTRSLRGTLAELGRSPRPSSPMTPVFGTLVELFGGFHPKRKPVLWRLLVAQYLLYRALLGDRVESVPLDDREIESIDWRCGPDDEEEFRQALARAEAYAGRKLGEVRAQLGKR